jgi:hypothetical protein
MTAKQKVRKYTQHTKLFEKKLKGVTPVKKLGTTQQSVFEELQRSGGWYEGCGWNWDTNSNTTRIMESLVKRGLVTKTVSKQGLFPWVVVYTAKKETQNEE